MRILSYLAGKTRDDPVSGLRELGFGHFFLADELTDNGEYEKSLSFIGNALPGREASPMGSAEERHNAFGKLNLVIISHG
jgi:hypothetical protein